MRETSISGCEAMFSVVKFVGATDAPGGARKSCQEWFKVPKCLSWYPVKHPK
jgi:hypothetical protein